MSYCENMRIDIFLLLFCVCFFTCYCIPVSYRESCDETTAKIHKDRLNFKHDQRFIYPVNDSWSDISHFSRSNSKLLNKEERRKHVGIGKVKSVMPGEKTMMEGGNEDDDDDDGGEYEGLDYFQTGKKEQINRQDSRPSGDRLVAEKCCQSGKQEHQCVQKDTMPMMIIREVDMVAVQIPVKEPPKSPNEWSGWSECSKSCGNGVQSRWRLKPGIKPGKERQIRVRPCNLRECDFNDIQK